MPVRMSSLVLPITAVLLALLLYIGVYFATVDPMVVGLEVSPAGGGPSHDAGEDVMDAYRIPIDPGLAASFFYPIHLLDRVVRPKVWAP